ncbi:hypothetical protein [Paenibacillus macerans]|uniref:hypothetical protein n=1 Tax=Paenibacillus macerans TaxID=44252 RepID=UPI003D319802
MPIDKEFVTQIHDGKDVVFVENQEHNLLVYQWEGGNDVILKLSCQKDILAVRDLLNTAYPTTKGRFEKLDAAIKELELFEDSIKNTSASAVFYEGGRLASVLPDIIEGLKEVQAELLKKEKPALQS